MPPLRRLSPPLRRLMPPLRDLSPGRSVRATGKYNASGRITRSQCCHRRKTNGTGWLSCARSHVLTPYNTATYIARLFLTYLGTLYVDVNERWLVINKSLLVPVRRALVIDLPCHSSPRPVQLGAYNAVSEAACSVPAATQSMGKALQRPNSHDCLTVPSLTRCPV